MRDPYAPPTLTHDTWRPLAPGCPWCARGKRYQRTLREHVARQGLPSCPEGWHCLGWFPLALVPLLKAALHRAPFPLRIGTTMGPGQTVALYVRWEVDSLAGWWQDLADQEALDTWLSRASRQEGDPR
jgi:hypothetical protein